MPELPARKVGLVLALERKCRKAPFPAGHTQSPGVIAFRADGNDLSSFVSGGRRR